MATRHLTWKLTMSPYSHIMSCSSQMAFFFTYKSNKRYIPYTNVNQKPQIKKFSPITNPRSLIDLPKFDSKPRRESPNWERWQNHTSPAASAHCEGNPWFNDTKSYLEFPFFFEEFPFFFEEYIFRTLELTEGIYFECCGCTKSKKII